MPTLDATLPRFVRSFNDPQTGVLIHQLTDGPNPAASLYFTQPTWTADGKYFLYLRKIDRAINYFCIDPEGSERQLTNFPATPTAEKYGQWMHRKKLAEECERFSFLWPAIHPERPVIVFPFKNEIFELDIETGRLESLFTFDSDVSEQGFFAIYQQFTADGRHLVFSTSVRGRSVDAPYLPNDASLKDEITWEGRLWRYDYINRKMEGEIFHSNGEQAHLLACPWDADILFWANYKHACLYAMRRDGTGLRSWFIDDPRSHAGHYSWDPAHRAMVTLISDPADRWTTGVARISLDTGAVHRFTSNTLPGGQWHPNPSPDGRWIVMDRGHGERGPGSDLFMLHQDTDKLHHLCRIGSTWGLTDEQGGPVKSEWLHPNPLFSPDGRYVIFHSDFGSGVAQIYAVDLSTWAPHGGV